VSNRPAGRTDAELEKLVEKFETGRLPKYDWSHSAHLTVGAYYILNYGSAEALIRLRAGIRNLNMAHGIANSELLEFRHHCVRAGSRSLDGARRSAIGPSPRASAAVVDSSPHVTNCPQ
jgi:hypothetical protein